MKSLSFYRTHFLNYLAQEVKTTEPRNLYEPMEYILNIGGKRLRPVAVLMTAEFFGVSYKKALDAALAIEIFHNFSLVHDDIMDNAEVRRGMPTVHEKWDANTAILSGDAMLINAYQLFENYEGNMFKELAKLFSRTAIKVCEGQQYDVDYENKEEVKLPEYEKMIEYKTAVLLGAAMEMGAIVADVDKEKRNYIFDYGRLLGIGFQLQDDYLDVFGDYDTFGKKIGGDIVENKKTYLYLKALENATAADARQLRHLYSLKPADKQAKIMAVKHLFKKIGVQEETQSAIKDYTNRAFNVLDSLEAPEERKKILRAFGDKLLKRKF